MSGNIIYVHTHLPQVRIYTISRVISVVAASKVLLGAQLRRIDTHIFLSLVSLRAAKIFIYFGFGIYSTSTSWNEKVAKDLEDFPFF